MKFSTRLSIMITALFLAGFSAMFFFGYKSTTGIVEQNVKQRLEGQAFQIMDKIDRMLFERLADMSVLATDRAIASRTATPLQISQRLGEYQGKYRIYSSLSFFNMNRVRLADTSGKNIGKQHAMTAYWREIEAGKDMVMTVTESQTTKQKVVHFVVAVRDKQGRRIGVVASRMPIEVIHQIADQSFRSSNSREAARMELLDGSGMVLYSSYQEKGILETHSSDWEEIKGLLAQGKSVGSERHAFQGEEEITAFARQQGYDTFKGNGWVLTLCLPVKTAFAEANKQAAKFTAIFICIGVAILLGTYFVSRAATKPLHELSQAAADIGKGNRDVSVSVRSGDEIGRLAQAFNKMVVDLRESENKYKELVELLPQVVYETDTAGKLTFVNRHALQIFGYTQQDIDKGMNILDAVVPEDHARLGVYMSKALAGEKIENVEYSALRKDKSRFPFLIFAVSVKRGDKIVGSRGIGIDITERKKAEIEAREREAFLSNILDSIQDGISILNADLQIIRTNKTMELWVPEGLPFAGRKCYEAYHRRGTPCEDCPSLVTLRDGKPNARIFSVQEGGSGTVWLEHHTFPLLDADKSSVVGVIEHVRDISERIRTEQEVRKVNQFRDRVMENATNAIYAMDVEGRFIMANRRCSEMTGYGAEEFIGLHFSELFSPQVVSAVREKVDDVSLRGKPASQVVTELTRKDGSTAIITFSLAPLFQEGKIVGVVGTAEDITERTVAEKALKEGEEKLRRITDTAQDAIVLMDDEGLIGFWNPAAEKIFGYSSEEILGKELHACLSPVRYYEAYAKGFEHYRKTGEGAAIGKVLELDALRKDGTEFKVELSLSSILINEKWHAVGIMRDITVRKKAEQEIRKFESLVQNSMDFIGIASLDGNLLYLNPAARTLVGLGRDEEAASKRITDFFFEEDIPRILETMAGTSYWRGEFRLRHFTTNAAIPVEMTGFTITDMKTGQPIALATVNRDITEQKRAAEKMRELEHKYHHIFDNLTDAAFVADAESGVILDANVRAVQLLGRTRNELLGMLQSELHPPDKSEEYRNKFAYHVQQGRNADYEGEVLRKDGTVVPVSISAAPSVLAGRKILLGLFRDITERKYDEAMRKKAEVELIRHGEAVKRHNDALVALARNENIFGGDLNAAFQSITEATAYALDVGRVSIWFYVTERTAIQCMDLLDRKTGVHSKGGVLEASDYPSYFAALQEELFISADSALTDPRTREFSEAYLKPLGITSMLDVPVRVAGKEVGVICNEQVGAARAWTAEEQGFVTAIAGFTSIALETRDRKKAEAAILRLNEELEVKVRDRTKKLLAAQDKLVRKEKLATLGQVAGTVGHELRNPLGVMNNAVYFLQTVLTDADETTKEYLGIIKSEIGGAERIVSDLLDAVRTKPPRPQLITAEEMLRMSLEKCKLPENIVVEMRVETKQRVLVDPFQMNQVFINLINNAAEAMSKGGRITISVGENPEKKNVSIKIEDEGAGITTEHIHQIFQPLFTTKARGIGLGLVVVKNLTEANGGKVTVKSDVGKGTVFTVTLPAQND